MKAVSGRAFAGRRVQKARRLVSRLVGLYPLTALGLLVIAAAIFALRSLAFERMDLVYLVVGYAGLGLPALSLLSVLIASVPVSLALRRQRSTFAESVDTKTAYFTGFALTTAWYAPLVSVSWEWASPSPVSLERPSTFRIAREKVAFEGRGVVENVERRIVIGDVFGLVRISFVVRESVSTDVLPHLGALRNVPALMSLAGGDDLAHPLGLEDGDRIDLRRYAPGDPARFIHWKVYGRTRKLVVRRPERALSRSKRTVAYLVAGPDDEATAAVARVAIETGALGGEWVFGADGSPGTMRTLVEARRAIAKSSEAREEGGRDLAAFLRAADAEGPSSVVLFVPAKAGAWSARVLAALAKRDVRVIVGVDTLERKKPPSKLDWVVRLPEPKRGTWVTELDEMMQSFSRSRVPVTVLERHTGRVLGDAHTRSLAGSTRGAKERAA
jgi:uncharacterized protein (DUF58 family)